MPATRSWRSTFATAMRMRPAGLPDPGAPGPPGAVRRLGCGGGKPARGHFLPVLRPAASAEHMSASREV